MDPKLIEYEQSQMFLRFIAYMATAVFAMNEMNKLIDAFCPGLIRFLAKLPIVI